MAGRSFTARWESFNMSIKVLLVDDHTVVREGLRFLLETEGDIKVIGEAKHGREAVQMTEKLRPDVVLLDIAMPFLNGVEAARQIMKSCPETKILILSSYEEDEYIRKLIQAGVGGYLLKHTVADDLVRAVREVQKGNAYFSPSISKRLSNSWQFFTENRAPNRANEHLTTREAEILQLIAEGFANKQIADIIGISIKTVEKHRQAVMDKLGLHEVASLTRYAIQKGIVELKRPPQGMVPAPEEPTPSPRRKGKETEPAASQS
jgi:DNA-binding NarL/FixJ family response regulator